jgi:hypothetical protein
MAKDLEVSVRSPAPVRLGRFLIASEIIWRAARDDGFYANAMRKLFAGMIVVDVRTDPVCDTLEYVAAHERFDPVSPGCRTPLYEISCATTYCKDNDGNPTPEVQEIEFEWRRVPEAPGQVLARVCK